MSRATSIRRPGPRRRARGSRALWLLLLFSVAAAGCSSEPADSREVLDLSGDGWRLWWDAQASWEQDELHLPGVDVSTLPGPEPTGGWGVLATQGRPVSVPSTVEAHLWDEHGGDLQGVSWWSREVLVPAQALASSGAGGRRALLRFQAVRLRAEVFLDERLVGYDAVGNTPFEIDVTDALRPGERQRLAVRVTDPGGNFDWVDHTAHRWGDQPIPASHGFGGVTGPVSLLLVDALHVGDVFVRNTPAVTDVEVQVAVRNDGDGDVSETVTVSILDAAGRVLARTGAPLDLPAGTERTLTLPLAVTGGRPWSPDVPVLHRCRVALSGGDASEVRFGLRWFDVDGIGRNAVLRLNGRRVVLRSAISWGFWPLTGLVPTPELARRQVELAKALGLNMLNHHRTLAAPGLLDLHDELGLLAYEEPGGYWSQGGDALCFALAREKWLRMVRRDRNHPSLVILNMINESLDEPAARHVRDLLDAQALDPTRLMTFTSAWAEQDTDSLGLHVRPGQAGTHTEGWWDQHNAPGPGVYRDEFYNGPQDHLRASAHRSEIVFWGEDGAIATPPRLARIATELEGVAPGWDGRAYQAWKHAYDDFLEAKRLRSFFPDLDALTASLGNVAFDYHARILENVRLGDVTDGFVINGWDGEVLENHSGIVDAWRHPKGDVERLARAGAPLHLAVKLRRHVGQVGRQVGRLRSPAVLPADVYVLNEVDLQGPHRLVITVRDEAGKPSWRDSRAVTIRGGDVFGQALAIGIKPELVGGPGRYRLEAELLDTSGEVVVRGHDEFLLVDWHAPEVPPGGAVLEGFGTLRRFFGRGKGVAVPAFTPDLGALDWIAVAGLDPEPSELVPPEATSGLRREVFADAGLSARLDARDDTAVNAVFTREGPLEGRDLYAYALRWSGRLEPPETGPYHLHVSSAGGVRLWIDGQPLIDRWVDAGPRMDTSAAVRLAAGKPVTLRLEVLEQGDAAWVKLHWTRPSASAQVRNDATELLRRVRDDGTTLLVLNRTDAWARLLAAEGALTFRGRFHMGRYWLGGNFFVREHPLFADLPSNGAMNWEYQELVHYGMPTYGLLLEDEEVVVACVSDHQPALGTAVGIVRHGEGRILLCTLDIPKALPGPPGAADLVRKLLMNFVTWAAAPDG